MEEGGAKEKERERERNGRGVVRERNQPTSMRREKVREMGAL